MKKLLILLMSLFLVSTLVACGETETEEKEIGSVETSGQSEDESDDVADETDDVEDEVESEGKEFNEVVMDDDNVTVTLKGIETERDDIFGDQHKIKMEIENKTDITIEVQSREVSIDGFMVDDMVFFSETVAAGKKSNTTMEIMALDEDLPELNENIEFILLVFNSDTFEDISEESISVNVN